MSGDLAVVVPAVMGMATFLALGLAIGMARSYANRFGTTQFVTRQHPTEEASFDAPATPETADDEVLARFARAFDTAA